MPIDPLTGDHKFTPKPETQTFDEWHSRHGCTTHELWLMQNMLGSVFGWHHPVAVDAAKAWKHAEYGDNEV